MKKFLIVEDDHNRIAWFHNIFPDVELFITDKPKEAIEWLKEHEFETIFLDHDLGDKVYEDSGPGTGFEVAQYLSEIDYKHQVILHTCNPIGAVNMSRVLTNYTVLPFPRFIELYKEGGV